jgi:NAD(P)-dependent dehydrogenase (short-subunit alcohol dehydrogenase family)
LSAFSVEGQSSKPATLVGDTVPGMKVALVTGPSSGIGRATSLELGRKGFHVVAAGRSEKRVAPLIDLIREEGGSAEFLHLDLASLESARDAAHMFAATGRELDVLVNNAGVGATKGITADGFELQFGVNHLGHFMLTHHLGRIFRPGTRIVVVTSSAHFRVDGIDFDKLQRRTRSLYGLDEYAVSKLANILFVRELAHRRPDWNAYAVHPGLTSTNIIPWYVRPFMRRRLLTPKQGAETVIWCASSDEVVEDSGLYYSHKTARPPSMTAQDDDLARELWERSEQWCGVAPQH